MEFSKAEKVVIITEASILDDVIKMAMELGALGYTVTGVTGKGTWGGVRRGIGALNLDDLLKNVRIDIITNEEIANTIAITIVERFFKHYAGIVYVEDVKIIRTEKFRLDE